MTSDPLVAGVMIYAGIFLASVVVMLVGNHIAKWWE